MRFPVLAQIGRAPHGERVVPGIHTDTEPVAPLVDGHAWLTLMRGGRTEAYGLWPANPTVPAMRLRPCDRRPSRYRERFRGNREPLLRVDSGPGEDVRSRYAREGGMGLHEHLRASRASGTAYRVTGERVNASEPGGLTDTPRQLSESIDQLERRRSTSREALQEPDGTTRDRSSLSGSLSTTDPGDRELGQLLSAVGDPERLRSPWTACRHQSVVGHSRQTSPRIWRRSPAPNRRVADWSPHQTG